MDDIWWIIVNVMAHMCLALLVIYLTCLIIRGLILQDHSEGEKHHD